MNSPKKILVIDDDADVLETIQLILEIGNFKVHTLLNGAEVFNKVAEVKPDLILLDVVLGTLDGRDICRKLKTEDATRHIAVLMMSGLKDYQYVMNEPNAPDDFLSKPFDINVLLGKIRTLLASGLPQAENQ